MIEIGPIILRAWRRDDLKRVWEWENDFSLMLYSRGKPHSASTPEDVEDYYEEERKNKKRLHYVIELKEESVAIGTAVIRLSDWAGVKDANIGTYIDKKYWNRGLGKFITLALLEIAFHMSNLERCEACSLEFNKRAHRVLESCGFKMVGRKRKAAYVLGKKWDWYCFDILKEEYMDQREKIIRKILGEHAEDYLARTKI